MSADKVMRPQDVARFWAKVDRSGECWLWMGRVASNGYGHFWLGGRNRLAHRVAVEMTSGLIPGGLQVDHLCRTTRCVRPDHLELTTPRINTLRGQTPAAANAAKTQCVNGHPYDELNTRYSLREGRTTRVCRACVRNRDRVARTRRALRAAGVAA